MYEKCVCEMYLPQEFRAAMSQVTGRKGAQFPEEMKSTKTQECSQGLLALFQFLMPPHILNLVCYD